ncbi:MAG: hypothetical protein K940chlam3_00305 [Chlamydiae bacterium]|nr:hypothetical protein [Chlamydiota bacterium]
MSRLKNGVNKAVAFSATLLMMTGMVSSASAAWDACCPDPCCPVDCCEMPDYTLYVDFLYWQVHPEGLEFARQGGVSANTSSVVSERGCIFTPECEFEPGFRVGAMIDLGCCNWDFYAQYTYLCEKFGKEVASDTQTAAGADIDPFIYNLGGLTDVTTARGDWDSHLNALDFGLGRTFEVNCCFDFRPHLGFKATWQELKYTVTYDRVVTTIITNRDVLHFKTDFDGIGLRGGFDAAWRFSPCFSIVGGFAASAVYSDICSHRNDTRFVLTNGTADAGVQNVDLKVDHCVLVPVLELLLGIRWDSRVCDCYDMFVFVGWENQVWWDLNRYILFGASSNNNNIEFGPHGNLTYQGLTVRAGMGF